MIVLVDEEASLAQNTGRRFRNAPPVSNNIGGKEWDGQTRERKHLNTYDPDTERARGNSTSLRHNKNARPGSALSGVSGKHGMPTPSGDVSEFSFQLK